MSISVEEAYESLEQIITQGFLTVGISFKDIYLVIKNITDKEIKTVPLYIDDTSPLKDYIYKLSACTFSVDGDCVLVDRNEKIRKLMDFYYNAPSFFIEKVVESLKKLNEYYTELMEYLEGFCYTGRSKQLWKIWSSGGDRFNMGIYDTGLVGMNNVQESWILINRQLDSEENYAREFSMAIIVSSSMNPKGARVLSVNFEKSKKELDELREEIARYGHSKKRVDTREDQRKEKWSMPIKTREDLVRELYRQMRGEKDMHDLFIDKWVQQQKDKVEKVRKEAEERQKSFRVELSQIDLTGVEDSKPVSLEHIKELKNKKKAASGEKYMSAYEGIDDKDRIMKKLSARVIRN